NYARLKNLIPTDAMLGLKIMVTHESPDNIYLTRKDITDFLALTDFETPLYEVVRDLFVICCLTGFRYSDISTLQKARFEDSFIYKTIEKTKQPGVIPIHPIVQQILDKYPNGLPACPPNQVFNRYLKEIGKKLPQLNTDFVKVLTRGGVPDPKTYKKYQLLQTHTARRSFVTNEYLNGTPSITLRKITGHKSEEFLKYIKADNLQHAHLMAQQWKKRKQDEDDAEAMAL
ncbi:MAG: site-specific integrase, partial [Bacteroidota bacterium]